MICDREQDRLRDKVVGQFPVGARSRGQVDNSSTSIYAHKLEEPARRAVDRVVGPVATALEAHSNRRRMFTTGIVVQSGFSSISRLI
jgi:hypothetical protein